MTTSKAKSELELSNWRADLTKFGGYFDTEPADTVENESWMVIVHALAMGDEPATREKKEKLPYVVPCLLKPAPYTRGTAERLNVPFGTVGLQRSSAHVTKAAFLLIDVDGLTEAEVQALLDRLRGDGVTYLAYSTHSNGRADKPGVRARLAIPLDMALPAAEYKRAWLGFDVLYCDGRVAVADASGANLHQQQGVWAAHPDRVGLAFKIVHKAGVLSARALIEAGPVEVKKAESKSLVTVAGELNTVDTAKVLAALSVIDPNEYQPWLTVGACLVTLSHVLPSARELWIDWSETADESAKRNNDCSGTDPSLMFDRMAPSMSVEIALATLMGMARDEAVLVVTKALELQQKNDAAEKVVTYLASYHTRTLAGIKAKFGGEL